MNSEQFYDIILSSWPRISLEQEITHLELYSLYEHFIHNWLIITLLDNFTFPGGPGPLEARWPLGDYWPGDHVLSGDLNPHQRCVHNINLSGNTHKLHLSHEIWRFSPGHPVLQVSSRLLLVWHDENELHTDQQSPRVCNSNRSVTFSLSSDLFYWIWTISSAK